MLKFLPIFIKVSRWIISQTHPTDYTGKQVYSLALNALNDLEGFYNYFSNEVQK